MLELVGIQDTVLTLVVFVAYSVETAEVEISFATESSSKIGLCDRMVRCCSDADTKPRF